MTAIRYTGALASLSADERRELLARGAVAGTELRGRVAAIIERVRRDGDAALHSLARELDGVELDSLEVPATLRREALERLDPGLRVSLERAARNIEAFHRGGLPAAYELETEPGVRLGRRPDPLGRVGLYAPGGRAAYPSTVLMCAIPARVAGVPERVLCSPPGPKGRPADAVLAAAELAGVGRVFALGGAGAVAAMALGTASVPRVDRIVGPGNAYVAEAKLQLTGACSIDSPAGPSELLVIADSSAVPDVIAREVVAQAEHDPDACSIALVEDAALATRVTEAVAASRDAAPRRAVIAESLARRGGVLTATLDEALGFASEFAPEHLLLAGARAEALLPRVRNAGTVCVGESASVAFGDYMTGANHTLPTGGLARSYSGLSTLDFLRWTTWQRVSAGAAAGLARDVARFAESEGLPAHAAAAAAWSRS